MGQTNASDSASAMINQHVEQFEEQFFLHNLPPKIYSVSLHRELTSLGVWVNGFQQTNLTEPEALGDLNLQVWLLRNDGTALSSIGKPILDRGWQQTVSILGEHDYTDSMLYSFHQSSRGRFSGGGH